jgi:hypothetical protein
MEVASVRKLAVAMAAGMLALPIAGCGNDAKDASAPAKDGAAKAAAQAAPAQTTQAQSQGEEGSSGSSSAGAGASGSPPSARKLAGALAALGYGAWPAPKKTGGDAYRIAVIGKGLAAKQFSALLGNYGQFEITVAGASPTPGMPVPAHVRQYPGQVTLRWWPWRKAETNEVGQALRWKQLDRLVADAVKKA